LAFTTGGKRVTTIWICIGRRRAPSCGCYTVWRETQLYKTQSTVILLLCWPTTTVTWRQTRCRNYATSGPGSKSRSGDVSCLSNLLESTESAVYLLTYLLITCLQIAVDDRKSCKYLLRMLRLFSFIISACMLYYCNTVRWAWLDRGLSGWLYWLTTLLQCFDTVGWVIRPVKTVGHITYIVLVQTLNHAQSINQLRTHVRLVCIGL